MTPGPTRPDRLTLWPLETGRFGVDVRWSGAAGMRRAVVARDQLRAAGMSARLDQDGDGWRVRVSPVERAAVAQVLDGYLY